MDLASATLMAEQPYFSAPLLDFESFTQQNSHFLLEVDASDVDGPHDCRTALESDGFVVSPIRSSKDGVARLFAVDRPR